MKQSELKLRAVKFKGGGEVRIIQRRRAFDEKAAIERDFQAVLDAHGPNIAGYAVIVWEPNLSSTAAVVNGPRSPMPSIMVPDFVRNRLLAERIEEWAVDAAMQRIFGPPRPE